MADPATPAHPTPPVPPDLRDHYATGLLMSKIADANPKARRKLLEIVKEAVPDLPIPQLDLERQFSTQVEEVTKASQTEVAALKDRLAKLEGRDARAQWRDAHELTEEELADVETFAKEKKIGDPEVALDYYRQQELGKPRASTADTMTVDDRKELYKSPKAWYEKQAAKVLRDLKTRRRGA